MKRENNFGGEAPRANAKPYTNEANEFRCSNCKTIIPSNPEMGTAHRNHCNWCLYSKHVDTRPGNRAATCHARMEPVGLTFKHQGWDKYGRERIGDVMLIHCCRGCRVININRIAADDWNDAIMQVFTQSRHLPEAVKKRIAQEGIHLLDDGDSDRLRISLYGKTR